MSSRSIEMACPDIDPVSVDPVSIDGPNLAIGGLILVSMAQI
jgi:hypothetical protein